MNEINKTMPARYKRTAKNNLQQLAVRPAIKRYKETITSSKEIVPLSPEALRQGERVACD